MQICKESIQIFSCHCSSVYEGVDISFQHVGLADFSLFHPFLVIHQDNRHSINPLQLFSSAELVCLGLFLAHKY